MGLATWSASEGGFKARREKTHVVKVKSNAVRDNIVAEALKEHASFDQSFDSIPSYVSFQLVCVLLLVIQQSCDLKWLTFIGYSTIM